MKYRNSIIIEGPDCSGKTTLAKKINERFNYECDIVHCTGHDPKDYNFYLQLLKKKNIIFDRQFVGEMIYPKIFNRESELSDVEFKLLVDFTIDKKIPVIIVIPPENILIQRLKHERPFEEQEIKDTIIYAREQFLAIAKLNKSFILVEPKNGDIDVDSIILEIERIWNEKF